jgi:hypothetical protein
MLPPKSMEIDPKNRGNWEHMPEVIPNFANASTPKSVAAWNIT